MTDKLSMLAKPLESVAKAVWPFVRRIYQERQAGQMPVGDGKDLLDEWGAPNVSDIH